MVNPVFDAFDFDLLDNLIGTTLDRFKHGKVDRMTAVGKISHVVAQILRDGPENVKAYMEAALEDEDE